MRVITLDANNKVIGIKSIGENYELDENELVSDIGELGQIMKSDGTFIDPESEPVSLTPTIEDKINFLYYREKGLI